MDWNSATTKGKDHDVAATTTGPWSIFDRIYCISLKNRTDRRAVAQAHFARVGLADAVQFVLVDKDSDDSERGIYESHLLCMKMGLAAGARRMLIFEDDVVFHRVSPALIKDMISFLEANDDWRFFFLGCLVNRSEKTAYPSVVRIEYRSLAHAYVVTAACARELVEQHPWSGRAFDAMLRDMQSDQLFALYPSVAFQSNAASDNDRYLPLDRFRRFCGGLKHIQRANEFYHRHKRAIIAAHLLAVLVIGLACFQAIR
jgi:GR25 family glycosyltransferase involved in LPS biosynthesis